MNTHDNDIINRYIDGEMDEQERKAFEKRLEQDSSLKSELELYKEVLQTLLTKLHPSEEGRAIQQTLDQMREEYFQPSAKVVSFRPARWWIASAAAVIITIVLVWSPWKEGLYSEFAFIQMAPVAERGTPADSLLQDATIDFNEKKFSDVLPKLKTLLEQDTANAYVRFYYAIALLESDQTEKSRNELTYLYNGNSIFRYEAAFYMALSYLKKKDRTTCKEWLLKIPDHAANYGKAQRLLKEL